jgi:hypothetical protein
LIDFFIFFFGKSVCRSVSEEEGGDVTLFFSMFCISPFSFRSMHINIKIAVANAMNPVALKAFLEILNIMKEPEY